MVVVGSKNPSTGLGERIHLQHLSGLLTVKYELVTFIDYLEMYFRELVPKTFGLRRN